jgi:hypothetical protein
MVTVAQQNQTVIAMGRVIVGLAGPPMSKPELLGNRHWPNADAKMIYLHTMVWLWMS